MPAAVDSLGRSPSAPEEQFWQRYSPHHEFPLSSATSVALHGLLLALLVLLGSWLAGFASAPRGGLGEVPVYVLQDGGGQGNPDGDGNPAGLPANLVEDIGPIQEKAISGPMPPRNRLDQAVRAPPNPPKSNDDSELRRLIQAGDRAHEESRRMSAENRARLREGLRRTQGTGPKDKGPGNGDGPGPVGLGTPKEREERLDRWVMVFDTYSGEDYARQLAGLGAFLAIPRREGDRESYVIVRDLHFRPVTGRTEDLAEITRIGWTDAKRESIAPLCAALGIRPVPDHVLAFFPHELERKLLRLELQHKGLREDQIRETRFKIRKTASSYEPIVIEQKAK